MPNTTSENATSQNTTLYDVTELESVTYDNLFDIHHVRVLLVCAYVMVFLFGVLGNILVIAVIIKHVRMRTVTNFFLANLAVADLSVGIFCVLPNLSLNINLHWMLGKVMCKLYYFIQAMSYTASVLILTAISIERYFAITHPMKTKQCTTIFRLAVVVILIWILSAVYAGPMLLFYDIVTIPGTEDTFCLMVYSINMKMFATANFILCYAVPLTVITLLYIRISVVLWKSSKGTVIGKADHKQSTAKITLRKRLSKLCRRDERTGPQEPCTGMTTINDDQNTTESALLSTTNSTARGNGIGDHIVINCTKRKPPSPSIQAPSTRQTRGTRRNDTDSHVRQKDKRHKESALMGRRRVIRLLLAVVVSFAVCVLPYHVRILRQYWQTTEHEFTFSEKLFTPLSFIFYYLNSALNPVLYAFLSANFRRSLRELITCDKSAGMPVSMRSATYAHAAHSTTCKTTQSTV